MTFYQYGDTLIEIDVLSANDIGGWEAEVWDFTPVTGRKLMSAYLNDKGEVTVEVDGRLDVDLLLWCIERARQDLKNYVGE